jgi:transcription elongation factor GreB
VEDDDGKVERFRLVGPDEADGSRGEISVDAPLARALLGKRVDDEAWVRTPNGERCLYVNRIWYS